MQGNPIMISEILKQLIDQGETNVAQIAQVTGFGKSAIYAWKNGDNDMPVAALQSLICDHPNPTVRNAMHAELTNGKGTLNDASFDDLDVNRDGCIDERDLMGHAVALNENIGLTLKNVHTACNTKHLSRVERAGLCITVAKMQRLAGYLNTVTTKTYSKPAPLRLVREG